MSSDATPETCPQCGADLLDHEHPGFYRVLGRYSIELDRTVEWECPGGRGINLRSAAIGYAAIFMRAFVLVSLTAANVRLVSRGSYVAAFLTGGALSAVWWFAANSAAKSHLPLAWMIYALGASCGTMAGMWLGAKR